MINPKENEYTFVFDRKNGDHAKRLTNQDKLHLRLLAICTLLKDHDQKALTLIMKSEFVERFEIDETGTQARYIIAIKTKKKGDRYADS